MKVSLTLKQLTTKQYELTAKERLMVIIATGLIALFISLYINTSEAIIEPMLPSSVAVNTTNQPALSKDQPTPQEQPLRDLFAKPPVVSNQPASTAAAGPMLHNNVPTTIPGTVPPMIPQSMPAKDFKLTGVVSDEERGYAVIMSGGKSRAYGLQESIDTYKIVAINADHVVLANNNHKIVLRLESVIQKEGKTSDK